MSNYNSIVIGDYHLKDRKHRNSYLEDFEEAVFIETFSRIYDLIIEHNITKLILLGDTFDTHVKGEALVLFDKFIRGLPNRDSLEIIILNGNHEVVEGVNMKLYYLNMMKDFYKINYNIEVLSFEERDKILYCGHDNIHKLERLNKNFNIVFSHFRSGITSVAVDEIDIAILEQRAKLVVLGDVHHCLNYSNIVYTNSPIDTSFGSSNELQDHTPSVLLLNEQTLEWKWATTLTNKFRKYKRVYPSVKKFLEEVDSLREDAVENNNFYKIIVQDKKINLRKIDAKDYKEFAILELMKTDLDFTSENKEVVIKIAESLSSNDISDNLLEFIIKNCDHPEYIDAVKSAYANYEIGVNK